jgi:site-specific DNA-methyltransferase (adenine-specific)
MWTILRRICKPSAAMCFTCQQPFTTTLVSSNMREFRYDWVWVKNRGVGHLNAKKMPLRNHENVCVFYREQPTYVPQMTQGHRASHSTRPNIPARTSYGVEKPVGDHVGITERYPLTIQTVNGVSHNRFKQYDVHPTEKPVALYEYFLRTYTNPGDLALDPTAGVLTMAMAAHNTERSCVVTWTTGCNACGTRAQS